jgi:hypothetical protein
MAQVEWETLQWVCRYNNERLHSAIGHGPPQEVQGQGPPPRAGRKRGTQRQAIGRSRGSVTTKIMALTDEPGSLIDVRLLPGQAQDLRGTAALLEGPTCGKLLADRAFDANRVRAALERAGIEAVIPPKSNRRFPAQFDCDT